MNTSGEHEVGDISKLLTRAIRLRIGDFVWFKGGARYVVALRGSGTRRCGRSSSVATKVGVPLAVVYATARVLPPTVVHTTAWV